MGSLGIVFLPPSPAGALRGTRHRRRRGTGRSPSFPRGPRARSMLVPRTGGPPSEEGPRSGSGGGNVAAGPLKQSGDGRGAQAPLGKTRRFLEEQLQVNPSSPPPRKRGGTSPPSTGVLEPKWLLSLSLSLLLCLGHRAGAVRPLQLALPRPTARTVQ